MTGASSGIGAAYAEQLAAGGWDLIVVGRRDERLRELRERLSDVRVEPIAADLADPAAVDDLVARLGTEPPDMLVNNAGVSYYKPFVELPLDQMTELLRTNVEALVRLSRATLPGMVARGRGTVINVASMLAWSSPIGQEDRLPARAVYAGTKAFVVAFTQLLASETTGTGVHVQVVCPNVVRTEFHTRQGMDLSHVPRMEPGDVVRGSLADLEAGIVVSTPALADTTLLAAVEDAERALFGSSRAKDLPGRYTRDS